MGGDQAEGKRRKNYESAVSAFRLVCRARAAAVCLPARNPNGHTIAGPHGNSNGHGNAEGDG